MLQAVLSDSCTLVCNAPVDNSGCQASKPVTQNGKRCMDHKNYVYKLTDGALNSRSGQNLSTWCSLYIVCGARMNQYHAKSLDHDHNTGWVHDLTDGYVFVLSLCLFSVFNKKKRWRVWGGSDTRREM